MSKSVLSFLALSAALCLFSIPAEAQRRQQQAATPNFQSGAVWLTPAVGLRYRIDERWSFQIDTQLRFDSANGVLRDVQVRPGFEYVLSPHWAVAAGYVQFQRYLTGQSASRGPFQDILYRARIDNLPIAGRWRWEELFFDNGTYLIRTRMLAGVRIPIKDTPWELAFSNEVFLNVGNNSPNRMQGFAQNRAYAGFGRQLTRWSKASLGYELDTFNAPGIVRNVHNIRLNFVFDLN